MNAYFDRHPVRIPERKPVFHAFDRAHWLPRRIVKPACRRYHVTRRLPY